MTLRIRRCKAGPDVPDAESGQPETRDILIVTGTCGVGKSSVCRAWAGRRHGAAIDCDAFRTWIRDSSLRRANGYQEVLLAKHAGLLAEDYLRMGLDVAIDNVWTPRGLDLLQEQLAGKGRVRVLWLNCSRDENRRRDSSRSPSDVMGGRVDELQAELETMRWPEYVIRMDTTALSLEQTVVRVQEFFG